MKKTLFIILCAALVLFCPDASAQSKNKNKKKADENTMQWYYELEAHNVPNKGAVYMKVWSYGPDVTVARDQAMKNAVHGAIFRGVPANQTKRIPAKSPLVSDYEVEQNNKAFFDQFFATGGEYLRYVTKTTSASSDDILKYDKKNYKVGIVVTVQYDALKKMLEQRGIIESLTSGFAK